MRGPKTVGVKINLGFLELSGEWEPNDVERAAAWELYVELITRISVVPLSRDEGLLREALTSFYSIFASTREVLRRYGPETAEPKRDGQLSFAALAVTILNARLRPVLARWHPALTDWESRRPPETSITAHEQAWPEAQALRDAMEATRETLSQYADTLATACGVPALHAAPSASQGGSQPRS